MGLFDYEQQQEDDSDPAKGFVSVVEGTDGCLRVVIPADVAESQDISSADHMCIKEREGGISGEVI